MATREHTTMILPTGFRADWLRPEYEAGTVEAINAAYRWMNGGDFTTLEGIQVDWHNAERFNPEADAQVILAPDGQVIGYVDIWDANALHVRWLSLGFVHPDYMGRGLGSAMLQWVTERAHQEVHRAPADARVVLHQFMNTQNQAAADLLTHHGFQVVRHGYRMRIDLDQEIPAPVVPEGIIIRPYQPEEVRDMLFTAFDSFRDHWGAVEQPFDEFYKEWCYYMEHERDIDPSLWFVAKDGDEVAGVSICQPKIDEDPEMAWINMLGVRRPWRKRGLGLALLLHSFAEFRKRGKPRAGLGVDAENLTGALRIYEKAGMRHYRKSATYEYELRPGVDLLKRQ